MSTTGVLSVASCVSAIVDVLADSAKLLRHVRKSDEARFEALEASLYLGSTLLRTLYEADYRRFGEVYAEGDHIAREQLKDIIINFQRTLLKKLQSSALFDRVEPNVEELQIALDSGRVDATEALCQLHRRLALNSSNGISPLSGSVTGSPRAELPGASLQALGQPLTRQGSTTTRQSEESRHTAGSSFVNVSNDFGTGDDTNREPHPGSRVDVDPRTPSLSSPSSQEFPVSRVPGHENNHVYPGSQISMSSSATVTVAQPAASSPASQQPVIRQDSTATGRSEERRHSSFSLVSSGTDDDAQFEPHPGIRLDLPRTRSVSSTTSSYRSRQRSPPVPPVRFTQLHLPAPENKYLGFCKGAWKLQQYGVPNMNKVFSLVTRPTGYFRDRPYWKCDKCAYSGRVYGVEGRRPSWTCDPSWHVHAMTGIGYRWAFLAKSHIARSRPAAADHQHDGDEEDSGRRGPFGCIFCCAMFRTDTPAFGTLDMFMVHLAQTHHKFPPGFDPLLEKMKCVVGRVVDSGGEEDCDVNIPPM